MSQKTRSWDSKLGLFPCECKRDGIFLSSLLRKSDKLLIGVRCSDFHLFIVSVNRLGWRQSLGGKGVKNTVKEIFSFPPFFLRIMTFGFFNFLNFDSVNCHRVPQHLLRYLRNWLFLQITLIGDLVLATKGFGKGGRLYVWPCPGPWLVFSSLKFTVIYLMYRHIRKQMPHYDDQPEHATITSSGINTRSHRGWTVVWFKCVQL